MDEDAVECKLIGNFKPLVRLLTESMDETNLADWALFHALHSRVVSEVVAKSLGHILLSAATVDVLALDLDFIPNRKRPLGECFERVETLVLIVVQSVGFKVVSTFKPFLHLEAPIVVSELG